MMDSMIRIVVFSLRSREFGFAVESIVEVLRMAALVDVPGTPMWFSGMLNVRGTVIPVIDLGLRLGLSVLEAGMETRILVARTGIGPVGFLADSTLEVLEIGAADISHAGELAGDVHPVTMIASSGIRMIMVLDHEKLAVSTGDFSLPPYPDP
jgi:purine-binding chemotaxis protein CheW